MMEAPRTLTYASVVSWESVRIALTIAVLNDLEVKTSNLAARPNMAMATSANAMLSHSSMSTKDRKSTTQIRQMVEVPLFIKTDSMHNNDILRKVSNMGQHVIFSSFQQKQYTILHYNANVWYVLRKSISLKSEFQKYSIHGLSPPSFKKACCLKLNLDGVLTCDCGYKKRNGIPCHHLFAIEEECDLSDKHFLLLPFHTTCHQQSDKLSLIEKFYATA